jgi:hypothetical protein
MSNHRLYVPEALPYHDPETEQSPALRNSWEVDTAIVEEVFADVTPSSLPNADELVIKFRHDHYRGVPPMPKKETPASRYIPDVLNLMQTGARALILVGAATEAEEREIVHRALSDFGQGPEVSEVVQEMEDGIHIIRDTYRQRLALRKTVEDTLEPALDTPASAYRLSKLLAQTYQLKDRQTSINPQRQGLLELLVTPLEAKPEMTIPEKLLGRMALGEFDTLIAKDALVYNARQQDQQPARMPHTRNLVNFSRSLAAGLGVKPNEALFIGALLDGFESWPPGAVDEVHVAKSSLQRMLQEAYDFARKSVKNQDWDEFGNDPDAVFVESRRALVVSLSDWENGWPYHLAPEARERYTRGRRPVRRGQAPKQTAATQQDPEAEAVAGSESSPRNVLTYADREGRVFPIDGPEFGKRIVGFVQTSDAKKATELMAPILDYLTKLDLSTVEQGNLQFIKPVGKVTVGEYPVYRLLLGQLRGVPIGDSNLRAGQLFFSVNPSSAGGSMLYIHSLATAKMRQIATEQLPPSIQSHYEKADDTGSTTDEM